MTLTQILKEKKEKAHSLKKDYKLPIKFKPLGLVLINNKALLQKLYFWLSNLPIDFVCVWDFGKEGNDEQCKNIYVSKKSIPANLIAYDFIVSDGWIKNISKYFEKAVVPILPEWNVFWSVLKEYNPMKNEWNAYLYSENNEWSVFHAITRYLENYKITFDNKNLVKNVFEG